MPVFSSCVTLPIGFCVRSGLLVVKGKPQDDQSGAVQVACLCDNHTPVRPGPVRLWTVLQLLRDPAELQAEDQPESSSGAGVAVPENQVPVLLVAGEYEYSINLWFCQKIYAMNYGELKSTTEMRPLWLFQVSRG